MNANKVYGVTEKTLLEAAELLEIHSSSSGSREWLAAESIREILAIDPWATAENVIGGLRCELDSVRMSLVTVRDGRDGWHRQVIENRSNLSALRDTVDRQRDLISSLRKELVESYSTGAITPPESQPEYSYEHKPITACHVSIGGKSDVLGYVVDPEKKP